MTLKFRRPEIIIVGIGLLLFLAWLFGPTTLHRWDVLAAQRACMTYEAPPTQVVLTSTGHGDARPAPLPPCYSSYHFLTHPARHTSYRTSNSLLPMDPETPIFMHERVSSAGVRRLVVILVADVNAPKVYNDQLGFAYWPLLIEPGTFLTPRRDVNPQRPTAVGVFMDRRTPAACTFYAGQADPADASRFHVAFDVGGARRYIHFQLTPDGNALLNSHITDSPTPPAVLEHRIF